MLAYRIEHKELVEGRHRVGPYQANRVGSDDHEALSNLLAGAHNGCAFHPHPDRDFSDWDWPGRAFACYSEQAVLNWFSGYLEELAELGFILAIYEVGEDYVSRGNKQLAFDPHHAVLVEEKEIA